MRDLLHNAGPDWLCEVCGEPFPCPTGIVIYKRLVQNPAARGEPAPTLDANTIYLPVTPDELRRIVVALSGRPETEQLAARLRQVRDQLTR